MSMMVSFCAVLFFPRGVLDEILNLIESVSEGVPSYSQYTLKIMNKSIKEIKHIFFVDSLYVCQIQLTLYSH